MDPGGASIQRGRCIHKEGEVHPSREGDASIQGVHLCRGAAFPWHCMNRMAHRIPSTRTFIGEQ